MFSLILHLSTVIVVTSFHRSYISSLHSASHTLLSLCFSSLLVMIGQNKAHKTDLNSLKLDQEVDVLSRNQLCFLNG